MAATEHESGAWLSQKTRQPARQLSPTGWKTGYVTSLKPWFGVSQGLKNQIQKRDNI